MWARGDLEFLFESSTRYLRTEHSVQDLVRYRVKLENSNSISPNNHVLFCF